MRRRGRTMQAHDSAEQHLLPSEVRSDTHGRPSAPRRLQLVTPAAHIRSAVGELRTVEIGPLDLELGGRLSSVTIAYRAWGQLNAAGNNAVLVLHALTGDSRAAGEGGWWEPLIGSGLALDTDRAFVVCANVL